MLNLYFFLINYGTKESVKENIMGKWEMTRDRELSEDVTKKYNHDNSFLSVTIQEDMMILKNRKFEFSKRFEIKCSPKK